MTQMANSKAPKHDFAPAWLKIPSNDSLKSNGPNVGDHGDKTGRPRREDYHGGFNRFGATDYMYGPLQRQRSFDNYYDERRYSPQKFRHHSGDEDHFSPPGPTPYGYGYGYNGYNNHYRSQPALGKYQHPNSRYTNQMNGGFPPHPPPPPPPPPPYYDPYFYEYYSNEPYYNSYARGLNGNGNHKRHASGDKDSKLPPKTDRDKESKAQDSEHENKTSEEDFPSLNGDADSSDSKSVAKPVPSSGVWDKGPSAKLVNGKAASVNGDGQNNISDTVKNGQSKEGSNWQQSSNIYKSLVPKGSLVRKSSKDSAKQGQSNTGKDHNSNHPGSIKLPNSGSSSPFKSVNSKDINNKDVSCQSPTPPIDILNTCLVTTPKNLADKKSEFLKTLRKDKSSDTKKFDLTDKDACNTCDKHKSLGLEIPMQNGASQSHSEPMVNSINDLKLRTPMESALSSSLEAEQRLLKEMGWNEADYEEVEITEDEKKEFEKRSKQLKEQRNGFKKTLPSVWSPQHLPLYQPPVIFDDLSSLSGDSDLE